jgi:hypothetical protein
VRKMNGKYKLDRTGKQNSKAGEDNRGREGEV